MKKTWNEPIVESLDVRATEMGGSTQDPVDGEIRYDFPDVGWVSEPHGPQESL